MADFKEVIKYCSRNQDVFDELLTLCKRQMIVPYIGAGLSAFVFPTWDKLIKDQYKECFNGEKPEAMGNIEAAEKIENKFEKDGINFSQKICDIMGGRYGEKEWVEVLKKTETESISLIPKLFFGPIVTSNFDLIIEKAHNNKFFLAFPYHIGSLKNEVEQTINKRNRVLYKIHGCVSNPKDIIITQKGYEKVYGSDTELVKLLKKFFQGFNFLFLGCSLDINGEDRPIELLLGLQEKSGMPHYAIVPCEKEKIESRRKELEDRNIFPILFKCGEFDSIRVILDEIVKRIKGQLFKAPEYVGAPFIDRIDSIMNKITNNLNESECSLIALRGSAGVGKTRIMSEYAHKMKEKYEGIYWFDACSTNSVNEAIRLFVVNEALISKEENEMKTIVSKFMDWLESHNNYLFLLDNVDYLEAIKPFLGLDRVPTMTRHILITTRLCKDELPNISIIEVEVFKEEEARNFLKSYIGLEPDESADKIAYTLGYLPLALEQAAAYIKVQGESYETYLKLLEKEPVLKVLGKERPEPGAIPVRATWNITMQRIRRKSAIELLNICTFFAPDNIIDYWFIKASGVLPQPLQDDVKDQIKFNDVKTELKKYSLVRITDSDDGSCQMISMHRLLQYAVEESLKDELKRWVTPCLDLVCNVFDWENAANKELTDSFKLEFGHVIKIAEKSCEVFFEDSEKLGVIYWLFYKCGMNCNKMLYLDSAEFCCDKCIEISEKLNNEKTDICNSLFTVYNCRGLIYTYKLRYDDAIDDYNMSLNLGRQMRGCNRSIEMELAMVYMNRGIVYDHKYLHEKALSDINTCVDTSEYMYNIGTLADENMLALAYMNRAAPYVAMKRYDEALSDINKSIKIWERLKNDGDKVNDSNLATAYVSRSVVCSKMISKEQEAQQLSDRKARYRRNAANALLNYMKKQ